jgi:excisionase family DNA binding protein
MSEEKLLTVREVSHILNLTEKEVMDLAESSTIPAYKVGGVYLRFKRAQVEEYRRKLLSNNKPIQGISFKDWVFDFFYYNDFYIFSILLIILMLVVIFK